MKCAVGKCMQSSRKKSTGGKSVSFYRFPKDPVRRNHWLKFCNRIDAINIENERICSLHFQQEDFERNLKFEMGFSNRQASKLKPGTVPTIEPGTIADTFETATYEDENPVGLTPEMNEVAIKPETAICEEKNASMQTEVIADASQQFYIKSLQIKIDELQKENAELKIIQSQSALTIQNLTRQAQRLTFTKQNLEKALSGLFTEGQIKKLKNGNKKQKYTEADIAQSITLYSTSARAYNLLRRKHFPLPSVRTLQRWSQKLDVSAGILEPQRKY